MISPNTEVRLLSGVPFTNSYEHTRYFESKDDQTAYFLDKAQYSYLELTYQREERAVMVPASYDSLYLCNYLMYRNTSFGTKWFYAFITHKEYVNPNNTRVYFELDVVQTWMFDLKWNPSFVVREHRDRWNSDGTPVINTVDEELAYGTEYDNVDVTNYTPFNGYKWLVIVTKTPMHQGTTNSVLPSVVGTPTPLSVYLVPFKDNNTVPFVVDTTGNGAVISKPTDVMKGLYFIEDAQNNIVSLYITDFTGIPVSFADNTFTFDAARCSVLPAQVKDPDDTSKFFNCLYVETVNSFDEVIHDLGDKYAGFHPVTESKLLMHPYTQTVLADFKGNQAEFKTEYIQNANLQVIVKGSLGVSNKNSYGIKNYNYVMDETGDAMSDATALINNEANDIPVITNLLSAYIQGNRNALANQKDSIYWNGAAGMASNGLNAIMGGMMMGGMGTAGGITGMVQGAGNMYLQIAALNAKQKDIANTPPNIAKQGSNTSYTIGNGYDGVYIIKKQIKQEYIKKLSDFFYLYGYKINELKLPNLHTRTAFNFVQTAGANLTGNIPGDDMDKLKKVFDTGVTLWHTDDMLNFSLSNGELA
jgi:hypothetical protein